MIYCQHLQTDDFVKTVFYKILAIHILMIHFKSRTHPTPIISNHRKAPLSMRRRESGATRGEYNRETLLQPTETSIAFDTNLMKLENFRIIKSNQEQYWIKIQRLRRDRYSSSILTFIHSDFPSSKKIDQESEQLENSDLEVHINDNKWTSINLHQ